MKFLITSIFLFCFKLSFSQVLYLDRVFDVSQKTYTYKTYNSNTKLKLDFYKPDNIEGEMPLLIYVHGGGFSGGKRNTKNAEAFAKQMAERGYAVALISYRLTMKKLGFGCKTKTSDKIDAFNSASEDVSMAVKYFLINNKKFNINTSKIILVGSSAGAEAALNLVYVYNNRVLPKYFKFAGVISMSGAVTSVENINRQNAIPTLLFHGTNDDLVPYEVGSHHFCNKDSEGYLVLYGSKSISEKLKYISKSFYLYTIENGDHSWSTRPMYQSTKEILDFLYNDVLKKSKRQIEVSI